VGLLVFGVWISGVAQKEHGRDGDGALTLIMVRGRDVREEVLDLNDVGLIAPNYMNR
jgi:hypothetical protein